MEASFGEGSYRQKACMQERSRVEEGRFVRDPSVRGGAWREAILVLIAAAVLTFFGKDIVGKMLHKTKNIGWETPRGSPSLAANDHVNEFFPVRMQGTILMAVEVLPGTTSVLTDTVEAFSKNVSNTVSHDPRVKQFEPIVIGYYVDSKYQAPKEFMQSKLVSADEKMTILMIQATKMQGGNWNDANSLLQEWCVSPPKGYTLHITGMPAVLTGNGCAAGVHASVNTRDMNFEILAKAEILTLPIAILIMARVLNNVKLLVTAVCTVIVAFIISALCLIPWMDLVPVPKDSPAAMGSVIMACCLDYSLFLLSRFSEQHMERWPLQPNVDTIKRYTGRTISVSGILVAVAFFSSVLLPERNMQGTGICLGVAVLVSVGTSVILVPALLLVGGKLLTGRSFAVIADGRTVELHGYIQSGDGDELSGPSRQLQSERSFWLKGMRIVARSPVTVLGAVLLLMMPFLMHLPELNITADRFALLPMDMPAVTALRRVQDSFPVGFLEPFPVLVTSPLQGEAVHLNQELKEGVTDLAKYGKDIKVIGAKLGLNSAEIAAVEAGVADLQNGKLDNATLDPASLAAVAAGAAVAMDKSRGKSDSDALIHAMHAAKKTGCTTSEISHAVIAAIAELHPKDAQPAAEDATAVAKQKMKSAEVKSAEADVKREALEEGLSESMADEMVQALKQETHVDEHPLRLAAAKAGAAIARGKLNGHDGMKTLKDVLKALEGLDVTTADMAKVLRAAGKFTLDGKHHGKEEVGHASKEVKAAASNESERQRIGFIIASALMAAEKTKQGEAASHAASKVEESENLHTPQASQLKHEDVAKVEHDAGSDASAVREHLDKIIDKQWPLIVDVVDAVIFMSKKEHGMLLMPSGFAAMLDLHNTLKGVGRVSTMLSPAWLLDYRIDWAGAVALNVNSTVRHLYRSFLDTHVNGNHALFELHTTFPSIGAGGANWVLDVRKALVEWESRHPGYKAELAGGASEAADTRAAIMESMWTYLLVSTAVIMIVVYASFQSIMVPLRLAVALFFTLAATFGAGVVIYQTPLLHGLFPGLAYFDGISYEVLPLVTGVGIALGLDYDIFLVSRIVEFRLQRFSDRASIFRGVMKTGSVISAAGLIMSLAFSGLVFSNKLLFQQFGVLLITSVLFDTFVVRTVLVPALMLIAQNWNWWPREMPPGIHDVLEGEVESCGGLSRPMMGDTALGDVVTRSSSDSADDWYSTSGFIA